MLRAVQTADEPFLCMLFGQAHAPGLDPILRELQWRAQRGAYLHQFPQAQDRIILHHRQAVGRVMTHKEPDALRLVDLAILPEFQGIGLGTQVLHQLSEEAAPARLPLLGHVTETNLRALRFYQRHGWVIQGHSPPHLVLTCPPAQDQSST